MLIDSRPECYPAYYERNHRIQHTETTFYGALLSQCLLSGQSCCTWVPSWEISEAGLLKLIVISASNACEICTLSTSLSIYYNHFMEIYITPYQQLKEIRKLYGTFVDMLQESSCRFFFHFYSINFRHLSYLK